MPGPAVLRQRTVGEWAVTSTRTYYSPFADVLVEAVFTSPSGPGLTMRGFYEGDRLWKVRFNPGEAGAWRYEIHARPNDPALAESGSFTVEPNVSRGFLRA